jgi:uncharacterized protein YecT (DUF1311 family)
LGLRRRHAKVIAQIEKIDPRGFECVQAKTNAADQRLNAALQGAASPIDASQRQPLLAAQRLRLQYRDANCGFYGLQDGSVRQVQAAERYAR